MCILSGQLVKCNPNWLIGTPELAGDGRQRAVRRTNLTDWLVSSPIHCVANQSILSLQDFCMAFYFADLGHAPKEHISLHEAHFSRPATLRPPVCLGHFRGVVFLTSICMVCVGQLALPFHSTEWNGGTPGGFGCVPFCCAAMDHQAVWHGVTERRGSSGEVRQGGRG